MTTDKEVINRLVEAGENYLAQLALMFSPTLASMIPDAKGRRDFARAQLLDALEAFYLAGKGPRP
jgi:hypothetical protein